MKKNNNNDMLMIAGIGLAGYFLLKNHHTTVDGISGISPSRKNLYKKYLFEMGYEPQDQGYQRNIQLWNKMSLQDIINDAYKREIILTENSIVRKDLVKRALWSYGFLPGEAKWKEKQFSKMSLTQLLDLIQKNEGENYQSAPGPLAPQSRYDQGIYHGGANEGTDEHAFYQ